MAVVFLYLNFLQNFVVAIIGHHFFVFYIDTN